MKNVINIDGKIYIFSNDRAVICIEARCQLNNFSNNTDYHIRNLDYPERRAQSSRTLKGAVEVAEQMWKELYGPQRSETLDP